MTCCKTKKNKQLKIVKTSAHITHKLKRCICEHLRIAFSAQLLKNNFQVIMHGL